MSRLWRWLTHKPYWCACGRQYRNEDGLSRCLWRHALEA